MFDREVCPICGHRVHAETMADGERELAAHVLVRRMKPAEGRREILCPGSGMQVEPATDFPRPLTPPLTPTAA